MTLRYQRIKENVSILKKYLKLQTFIEIEYSQMI